MLCHRANRQKLMCRVMCRGRGDTHEMRNSFKTDNERPRLKVPPALNKLTKTLDKNQLLCARFSSSIGLKTGQPKNVRLLKKAQSEAEGKPLQSKKPIVLKYDFNHNKVVVIAHDVDPIELVVWLPALLFTRKQQLACV
ncbi:hypothetical protein YC2023_100051 [Brassica napus]